MHTIFGWTFFSSAFFLWSDVTGFWVTSFYRLFFFFKEKVRYERLEKFFFSFKYDRAWIFRQYCKYIEIINQKAVIIGIWFLWKIFFDLFNLLLNLRKLFTFSFSPKRIRSNCMHNPLVDLRSSPNQWS